MRRPRWNPNTVPWQIATVYVREQGMDNEFHHAAARAFWESGINLGEMPAIEDIPKKVGLEWTELSQRLGSDHYGRCGPLS